MDTTVILIFSLIGILLWIVILRWIISDSMQVKLMREYKETEIRLLMLACRKLGATKEEIDNALKPK